MGLFNKKKYGNKEIAAILALQNIDGGWGYFHSLSAPTKDRPLRTEQALRRLWVMGLTKEDTAIKKVLTLLKKYLNGKRTPPDGREKAVNWDYFEKLMFAAWIKIFESDNEDAAKVASFWAEIVTLSFKDGCFNQDIYETEYRKRIPKLVSREKLIMPNWFYLVHLLKGTLEPHIENLYVDYLVNNKDGIFYIYHKKINDEHNKSDKRFLTALEQLKGYSAIESIIINK